jgi:hypothetical protein
MALILVSIVERGMPFSNCSASLQSVHDQRGWDALIAIGYSIQQPRPRHPDAATEEDRAALKKNFRPRLPRRGASIRARPSKSGRWMNTASVWRPLRPRLA